MRLFLRIQTDIYSGPFFPSGKQEATAQVVKQVSEPGSK